MAGASCDREERLRRIRHSAAHVLAQAVQERFAREGVVRLATGPATADGFFYDFELPRAVTPEDVTWVEQRMREILERWVDFRRIEISPEEARERFRDQPYKLEIVEGLLAGEVSTGMAILMGSLGLRGRRPIGVARGGSWSSRAEMVVL